MYSQQPSNVPTRLHSDSISSRKPRLKSRITGLFCKRAISAVLAGVTVVLSLTTGILAANIADRKLEVGFEPEYQDSAESYASDNELFEDYDNAMRVDILLYGKQELTVYSADTTVGELFEKLSLTIGENDVVSEALDASITSDMKIIIDRHETNVYTETKVIPFETEKKENAKLTKGTEKKVTEGVNGEVLRTITEKYINGVLVSSELTSEEITKEAVNEVIEVGTAEVKTESKPAANTNTSSGTATVTPNANGKGGVYTDSKGNSYEYLYYIDVIATAYGYSAGSVTATGKKVAKGMMAVDPKIIPYGTRCYVTGSYGDMGVLVAEDCGGFKGNRIDIFLGDDYSCIQFGRRSMRVYVLA
ncbi:MAG: G5 domain-containing protein [Clostridia bacterium]|nr:G5 domain-containing protein [Clostridia bacterium]